MEMQKEKASNKFENDLLKGEDHQDGRIHSSNSRKNPLFNPGDIQNEIQNDSQSDSFVLTPLSKLQILFFATLNLGFYAVVVSTIIIILPFQVEKIVGSEQKGRYLGIAFLLGNVALGIASPIFGYLSDNTQRFDKRKPYLIFGVILSGLGYIGLSNAPNYIILSICFVGMCIATSIMGPAFSAVIPDIVPDHQKGLVSSYCNAFSQLGGIIGSLAGLFLTILDLTYMSLILVGFMWICLSITCLTLPSIQNRKEIQKDTFNGCESYWKWFLNFISSLKNYIFRRFLLVVFMLNCGDSAFELFLEYYLGEVIRPPLQIFQFHISDAEGATSLWTSAMTLFAILGAFIFGLGSDYLGRNFMMCIGALCMFIPPIIFTFTQSYLLDLGLAALYGLGRGGTQAVSLALLADILPTIESKTSDSHLNEEEGITLLSQKPRKQTNYARDAGIYQIALLCPKIFVPFLGGFLLDYFQIYGQHHGIQYLGYYILYSLNALFFLTGALFIWLIPKRILPLN